MKKIKHMSLLLLLFISCGDDSEEDITITDFALPSIFIELVDADGNNLIANGTFLEENIQLEYPRFTKSEFVIGPEGTDFENLIMVLIDGFGQQTVNIILSDSITDNFSFEAVDSANLELSIENITYNSIEQDIQDFNNDFGDFIVTVVR